MKARDGDRTQSLALCEALGADDRGELIQRDTYFNVATGRLKLREERDAAAHLISYVRADEPQERLSRYRIVEVEDAEGLKAALSESLGARAVVSKRRRLFLWRDVRIHLDWVDGLALPLAQRLATEARHSWWSLFDVASTRGSHYGSMPLSSRATVAEGPFAAVTLGRVRLRSLPRFLREGARLGPFTRQAPGLVSAVSAGWPPTGNCTISIWESEQQMLSFAFGDIEGHGDTVRRDPPILAEQLNARLRVRRLGGSWGRGTMHPERLAQLAAALA